MQHTGGIGTFPTQLAVDNDWYEMMAVDIGLNGMNGTAGKW